MEVTDVNFEEVKDEKTEQKEKKKDNRGGARKGAGRPKKRREDSKENKEESKENIEKDEVENINSNEFENSNEFDYDFIEKSNDLKDNEISENGNSLSFDDESEFLDRSEEKGKTEDSTQKSTNIVTGKILLLFLDTLIPFLISFVYDKVKGKKIPVKEIRLDKYEREDLEPLADEVAKEIDTGLTPLQTLVLSMGIMYFTKLTSYESDN
jgi:hypothetical protein